MADTVIVFDPQGIARDVPYDRMKEAVAQGGTPGVLMKAPDGSTRAVPATKMQEAAQNGGQVLPLKDQQIKHPGAWAAFTGDLKGFFSMPSGVSPYPGTDVDAKQALLQQGQAQDQSRKAAGYSLPYRALAAGSVGLGVNASGMEQSAREGDAAGVMGHAATVPAVIAGGELAGRVLPQAAPPVIRGAVKATNKVLEKAPGIAGGAIGAGIGGAIAGQVGAEVGGTAGAVLGRDLFNGVKIPGENFGIKPPEVPQGPASWMGAADAMALKKNNPAAFELRQQQIAKYGLQDKPPIQRLPRPTPSTPEQVKATQQVVTDALSDTPKATQMRTQAQVDFYLKKGNVEAAQNALETAKNPEFKPPAPSRTTNQIRADQPEAQRARFRDTVDDSGVSQELNQDLQKHGYLAESEARKEFIARNSTGVTKGDLVKAAGGTVTDKPVRYTKNKLPKTQAPSDLTDVLQKSLDEARKRKGQQ